MNAVLFAVVSATIILIVFKRYRRPKLRLMKTYNKGDVFVNMFVVRASGNQFHYLVTRDTYDSKLQIMASVETFLYVEEELDKAYHKYRQFITELGVCDVN